MTQFDSEAFLDHILEAVERTSDRRTFDCPICQGGEWTIVDGLMSQEISGDPVSTVHTVPVVCDNCGFLARFAVGQD